MYKSYITDEGSKALANLNELEVEISKIAISKGKTDKEHIFEQTDLADKVCDLSIVNIEKTENVLNITGRIESRNVEEGFYIKQIGLFLNINGEEVLFQISQAEDGYEGDYIPSKDEAPDFFGEYGLNISINDGTKIKAVVDITRYVKKEELKPYALFVDITPKTHNIVISANDSEEDLKMHADYVCDGENDEEEINKAIASLVNGGEILLLTGNYNISGEITIENDNVVVKGCGFSTNLNMGESQIMIFGDYCTIENLKINGAKEDSSNPYAIIYLNSKGNSQSNYTTIRNLLISHKNLYACGNMLNTSHTGGSVIRIVDVISNAENVNNVFNFSSQTMGVFYGNYSNVDFGETGFMTSGTPTE